jgi:hypothetical protein
MAGPPPQPIFRSERFCCGRRCFQRQFLCEETLATPDGAGQHSHSATAEKEIQRSSVVERSAVNRLVVGSNPTAGANFARHPRLLIRLRRTVGSHPTARTNFSCSGAHSAGARFLGRISTFIQLSRQPRANEENKFRRNSCNFSNRITVSPQAMATWAL